MRLEAHRESLSGQLRRRVIPRRRYEDLCLIKLVTRLELEFLSQPSPGAKLSGNGPSAEHGIAEWARPWGPTSLLQFQADLNVFDLKVKSLRRWLSAATQRTARARATERFASIMAGMAGELKAAGFTLPIWASGRVPSGHPAPSRAPRRPAARRAPRRAASRRAADGPAASKPKAPKRSRPRAAKKGRINLNQASFAELRSLRLSVSQSHRVLAYRRRIGGYQSIEQLDDVPGFPEAVRERLKRRVTL